MIESGVEWYIHLLWHNSDIANSGIIVIYYRVVGIYSEMKLVYIKSEVIWNLQ